jgi:serine/threonine protein kinase
MVGKTVLQYQLIEKLGSGGMGDVYKAQDTRLNRFVAIKMLPAKMSADPDRRRRFVQEAQAASALNHPNIITIYDIVSEGDALYMVMEFVTGTTLHDSIPAGGLPVPQVLQYGAQMADALNAAHVAGIIHRDLKPSNVMITRSGLVKILDFGLAKLTDLTGQFDNRGPNALGPLTQEGAILGTVSYMSPEQAEGKPVDARSDIFSFGSVLYEMVTGRRAFDAGSSISTLSSVLRDDVKPVVDVAPGTPPLLEAIISRCLPKDPNARWQSMKEVENALTSLKRSLDSGVFYPPTQGLPVAPPATSPLVSETEAWQTDTVTTRPVPMPPPLPISSAPPVAPPPLPVPAPPVATPAPVAAAPVAPAPPVRIARPDPQAAGGSSKNLGLVLGLIVVVILAAAAAGGWWWWTNQNKAAPQQVAQAPAPQTAAPAPAPTQEIPTLAPVPAEPAPPAAEAILNNASILDLVQSKTPAADIVKQIRSSKTNFNVSKDEITRLKQAGVPGSVIQAMRNPTGAPGGPPPPPPLRSAQVAAVPAQPTSKSEAPATEAPKPAPGRPTVALAPVTVGDALPFRIILAADVPADAPEGQALRFTVVDGLKVDNNVVIAKGATVTGSVTGETGKKKILGMGGSKLTFRLLQTDGVDGKKVNVRAMSGRRTDGVTIRTFETTKGSKTKGLAAAQGTEYIGYIDGEQTVSVRK